MASSVCNGCGSAIFDQRYLKCGACLQKIGVSPLRSPIPPVINWKAVAHHQRHLRRLAELNEINLKRILWGEHEKRVTLVNAMSELVPPLAIYGPWCRACDSRYEEDGHDERCMYTRALAAIYEAGKSVDGRVTPTTITFTCHHCGEYFDEPMEAFIATASVTVLAPTLCKDCGHGGED